VRERTPMVCYTWVCLSIRASSLGIAFLMDMPGSILTKDQSTDIIN
jgi:hypothetical protein